MSEERLPLPSDMEPRQLQPHEIEQLLIELDQEHESRGPSDSEMQQAARSTVGNLFHKLQTLAQDLKAPPQHDEYADESQCRAAIELVRQIGITPSQHREKDSQNAASIARPLRMLGQYQLLSKLGEGGMGTVYKALHTRLDKVVALKLLPRDRVRNADAIARFEREMKAVGKLDHPHIVRAMDAGEIDDTRYLVMEYVQGMDLSRLVARHQQLPLAEACELIQQAAVGLQAAHLRGMVHRDIKPGNLMLAIQEDGPPIVKVLDLGLAQLNEHVEDGEALTSTGQLMGTLDYMAPEQGDNLHGIDIRADIYSLGATLYKLLTGQAVFSGPKYQRPTQKLLALANEPAPAVQAARPDVPDELAIILSKMLAKQPDERFDTPADVAEALAACAEGADLSRFTGDLLDQGDTDPNAHCRSTNSGHRSRFVDTDRFAAPNGRPVAAPPEFVPPRQRKHLLLAVAALPLILVLGGLLFRLRTSQGEVVVEVADDVPAEVLQSLKVEVIGNGEMRVASAASGWSIDIREGKYQVQLADGSDRLQISQEQVVVERNKKALVRVTFKPLKPDAKVATNQDAQPEVFPPVPGFPPAETPPTPPVDTVEPVSERETFYAHVATLPPEDQAAAVEKKLKEINPEFAGRFSHDVADGQVVAITIHDRLMSDVWPVAALRHLERLRIYGPTSGPRLPLEDLSPLQGLLLQEILFNKASIADLAPLRGMPLVSFVCDNVRVSDVSPLAGMQLNRFVCHHAHLRDLTPLKGMPITHLDCGNTPVQDLRPLQGMPITTLVIRNTRVNDLEPLRGMPIENLVADGSKGIHDLEPLRGMKLRELILGFTSVRDLTPLRGMQIGKLVFSETAVTDISPLENSQVEQLYFSRTPVADLAPLANISVKELGCSVPLFDPPTEQVLRSLEGLESIQNEPPSLFWVQHAARRQQAEEFAQATNQLAPELQIEAVRKRLQELNSSEVELAAVAKDGAVVEVAIVLDQRGEDLSPLRAFQQVKKLAVVEAPAWTDLSPLNSTRVVELQCPEIVAVRNRLVLKTFPALKTINGEPAAEYLKKVSAAQH